MDLKILQENKDEVIDVPMLFDDDGKATDGFKVVGANSKTYQEVDRKWKLLNVKKVARRGRDIDASTETGAAELVDMMAKREAAIAKACIVSIYGFTSEGEPAKLSDETLEAIFSARPRWRTKVVAAIEADQLFTTV